MVLCLSNDKKDHAFKHLKSYKFLTREREDKKFLTREREDKRRRGNDESRLAAREEACGPTKSKI